MKLPPNTAIVDGYIKFRKQYKGQSISRCYPVAREKQAVEEIYQILGKINRNEELFELEEHRITMSQAADLFWDLHASKKPECDGFPIYLARIKQHFGVTWYDTVTHEEVEVFLNWLRTTPFSQVRHKNTPPRIMAVGSVNLHHKCLISIFNSIPRWVELKKIARVKLPVQRNPASLIEKESETECTRTRVLSQEELERLLSVATPRAARIIQMAVFTLLRYNDLKEAKLETKDPQNALRGVQGKTSKGYTISTNGYSMEALDFTNFHREFFSAIKKANIKNFQFRDLRRTGATYLFRKTNDLGMVQQRLGHASPAMTQKYLGILDGDNIRASAILGDILSTLRPVSSVVERLTHIQEAAGSKPAPGTTIEEAA